MAKLAQMKNQNFLLKSSESARKPPLSIKGKLSVVEEIKGQINKNKANQSLFSSNGGREKIRVEKSTNKPVNTDPHSMNITIMNARAIELNNKNSASKKVAGNLKVKAFMSENERQKLVQNSLEENLLGILRRSLDDLSTKTQLQLKREESMLFDKFIETKVINYNYARRKKLLEMRNSESPTANKKILINNKNFWVRAYLDKTDLNIGSNLNLQKKSNKQNKPTTEESQLKTFLKVSDLPISNNTSNQNQMTETSFIKAPNTVAKNVSLEFPQENAVNNDTGNLTNPITESLTLFSQEDEEIIKKAFRLNANLFDRFVEQKRSFIPQYMKQTVKSSKITLTEEELFKISG